MVVPSAVTVWGSLKVSGYNSRRTAAIPASVDFVSSGPPPFSEGLSSVRSPNGVSDLWPSMAASTISFCC